MSIGWWIKNKTIPSYKLFFTYITYIPTSTLRISVLWYVGNFLWYVGKPFYLHFCLFFLVFRDVKFLFCVILSVFPRFFSSLFGNNMHVNIPNALPLWEVIVKNSSFQEGNFDIYGIKTFFFYVKNHFTYMSFCKKGWPLIIKRHGSKKESL